MILALLLAATEPATALEAERTFAYDAAEIGQWAAFAKWAADDGLIIGRQPFRRQFAEELAKAGEPAIAVAWWPAIAALSCDGKTAIHSGPYYSAQDGDFGRFQTVWSKTGAGWRYLVDMGFSLDEPLPAGDLKEPVRASCDNLPGAAESAFVEDGETFAGAGSSADGSLKWKWRIAPSKSEGMTSRLFRAWRWDGERYVAFIDVENELAK